MAEGLLGGLLGAEEESGDTLDGAAIGDGQGLAAGMAVELARTDPRVAQKAADFLDEQTRLLKLQAAHAAAEHPLRISHLKSQSREGKIRRVGQRIRVGMQAFAILILAVIGIGVAVMLYDAFTSRAVVVDAFKAPSGLASRGLTGDVVAAGVLDTLQKLQDATRGGTGLNTHGAWDGDVKIEVPETGVSIGEVNRLLHQRFGHDLHIDGDLIQQSDGRLTLTVRVEGVEAKAFTGAADQFDKLAQQAAEYVYGAADPKGYLTYLFQHGRYAEGVPIDRLLVSRATTLRARSQALEGLGVDLSYINPADAEPVLRQAIHLDPENWPARLNLVFLLKAHGREEDAWRETQAFYVAAAHAPKSRQARPWDFRTSLPLTQDWLGFEAAIKDSPTVAGGGGTANIKAAGLLVRGYVELHDWNSAETNLALLADDDPVEPALRANLKGRWALEQGRIDEALKILPSLAVGDPLARNTFLELVCWVGLAYDLADRPAEAQGFYATLPNTVACRAFHADGLEHRGDHARADVAYAQAIALAPDLPFAYHRQGLTLLARGDLDAATAKFEAAHIRGPHWADPLKGEGDVLARQRQWKAALAMYDQALKYAPAWAELHQARNAAAQRG